MAKDNQCVLCGEKQGKTRKGRSILHTHHLNRCPDITITVCMDCHYRIHNFERTGIDCFCDGTLEKYIAIKKPYGIRYLDMNREKATCEDEYEKRRVFNQLKWAAVGQSLVGDLTPDDIPF